MLYILYLYKGYPWYDGEECANEWELREEPSPNRTHKHVETDSSLVVSTDNSKMLMHSHPPENGRFLCTDWCQPNGGSLFTWPDACLPWDWCLRQGITLRASLLARHYQQPGSRPVKGDDDIAQIETTPFPHGSQFQGLLQSRFVCQPSESPTFKYISWGLDSS